MIRKALIVLLTLGAVTNAALLFGSYHWPRGYHFSCPVEFPKRPPGFKGGYSWSWQLQPGRFRFSHYLHQIPPASVGTRSAWEIESLGLRVGYALFVVTTGGHHRRVPLPTAEHYGTRYFLLDLPLWMPLLVLTAFPTIAFICGPLRRRRRRKRGECVACGYNLTGNVSGICSECGTEIKPP